MNACGIITEYNPFHNGHQYHLDQAKQATACEVVVNVMSGNFVQRGEAAIVDKWTRAHAAITAGCDVVIELPYIYATQAAHKFAKGAVNALQLAQVKWVVFGSETHDLAALQAKTRVEVPTDKTKSTNQQYIDAMGNVFSNDILGINYLIALQDTCITPLTIQRTNAYQSLELASIASASAIRQAVYEGKRYEQATPMHHLDDTHRVDHYYPFIQQQLLALSSQELARLFLVDEGIENHLKKCAKKAQTYEAFLALAITKKYPKTRIQR
ncbi:MAG: nucleotidyltransferase family protein, partial [Erysipelotrichaceae bacterium]